MRIEIPVCTRCCGFIPLRYGIIILGYFNLVFTILVMSLIIKLYITYKDQWPHWPSVYRGVQLSTQLWVPLLLYIMEIIFNVVLLIGAHFKMPRLIRAYYYYGITTALAALVTALVMKFQLSTDLFFDLFEDALVFSGFVLQVYLLLMIRSELSKTRYREGLLSFVNNNTEILVHPHVLGNGRNPL